VIYPSALLWVLFVLRPLRFYGAATWFKQGWVTRQTGVEVELAYPDHDVPDRIIIPESALA
jgi:hypothetical protein